MYNGFHAPLLVNNLMIQEWCMHRKWRLVLPFIYIKKLMFYQDEDFRSLRLVNDRMINEIYKASFVWILFEQLLSQLKILAMLKRIKSILIFVLLASIFTILDECGEADLHLFCLLQMSIIVIVAPLMSKSVHGKKQKASAICLLIMFLMLFMDFFLSIFQISWRKWNVEKAEWTDVIKVFWWFVQEV